MLPRVAALAADVGIDDIPLDTRMADATPLLRRAFTSRARLRSIRRSSCSSIPPRIWSPDEVRKVGGRCEERLETRGLTILGLMMDERFAKATGGRLLFWQPATGEDAANAFALRVMARQRLLLDVHRDRLAQAIERAVQVVAELQRQLVRAGFELHVDFGGARAEVNPRWRALHDFRSWRQTVHVDAEMVMAHTGANLLRR